MRNPIRFWTPGVLLLSAALILLPLAQSSCLAQEPSAQRDTHGHLPQWDNTLTAHLEALALLQTLNAQLLSHDSATLTLDRWCAAHQMASPPRVVADRQPDRGKPPTSMQRQELGVSASEPVRYRRVQLRCGDHVLSQAENWYVPGRLTSDMNHLLDTTDVSFGRVAQPLHFSRHVLDATVLWSPLPAGWDTHSASIDRLPNWPGAQSAVLRHRAVLVLPDGRPISEVVETYTAQVLAFAQPRPELRSSR